MLKYIHDKAIVEINFSALVSMVDISHISDLNKLQEMIANRKSEQGDLIPHPRFDDGPVIA